MIITWIYNTTGRSVPIVGIFHAGLGVATGADLVPAIAPDFEMLWVYAGSAVAGALVLALTRGWLGIPARACRERRSAAGRRIGDSGRSLTVNCVKVVATGMRRPSPTLGRP